MVLAKLEALVVRVWDLMLLASVQGRARALGFGGLMFQARAEQLGALWL